MKTTEFQYIMILFADLAALLRTRVPMTVPVWDSSGTGHVIEVRYRHPDTYSIEHVTDNGMTESCMLTQRFYHAARRVNKIWLAITGEPLIQS